MACRASGVGGAAFSVFSFAFMKTMTFIEHSPGWGAFRFEDASGIPLPTIRKKIFAYCPSDAYPVVLDPDARPSAHRCRDFRGAAQGDRGPASVLPGPGHRRGSFPGSLPSGAADLATER